LRVHFSEDELVELGLHCAVALGVGRLSATWDVSDDLPETNGSSERLAPWNSASVVASGSAHRASARYHQSFTAVANGL
jgi:hypothetical protein